MFANRTHWNLTPNPLSEALERHRAAEKPLLDLTVSNPTECGFTYDQGAILDALRNPAALHYEPVAQGLATARQAVAAYYAEHACAAHVDDVFLVTSTSEAYSYVFRLLCNPRDEILIPAPGYPLFDFLADIQDVKLVRYPLLYDHGWQIDFHSLEQAITSRARGVVVVQPNNPTGHYAKRAEIEKLSAICMTHKLPILSDEVFLDFSLGAELPPSFAGNRNVLTFTMSGLSKICGLPQMKAAWLVVGGPQDARSEAVERLEVIADTYLSMNAPVQLALPSFLGQRQVFRGQVMDRVRRNLTELDRQLAKQKACSRLETEGGWYAILGVPAARSDEQTALALLNEKSVYVHPGHFYDFSSEGYLVVSLIVHGETFMGGIGRLLSFF
jgi:alanine-synthesizing transaminase